MEGRTPMEQNSRQVIFGGPVADGLPVRHPTHSPGRLGRADEGDAKSDSWNDEQIKFAVMTALHWDLAVPRNRVSVRVDYGWITLTGQVDRMYEKSCAEADARMTPGVAGVTNEIECRPAG
jgi:osmotically-inducible protein OsmY